MKIAFRIRRMKETDEQGNQDRPVLYQLRLGLMRRMLSGCGSVQARLGAKVFKLLLPLCSPVRCPLRRGTKGEECVEQQKYGGRQPLHHYL